MPANGSAAPLTVGPAAWRDLPAVYRVHRACFPSPYSFWRFVGYQMSQQGEIQVAVEGHRVVGYLVLNRGTHGKPPRVTGEIVSLAVLEPYRRRGLARMLLGEAHRKLESDGLGECLLQVAVSNLGAQKLYDQMGYQVTERIRRYYSNGEDAFLMSRTVALG